MTVRFNPIIVLPAAVWHTLAVTQWHRFAGSGGLAVASVLRTYRFAALVGECLARIVRIVQRCRLLHDDIFLAKSAEWNGKIKFVIFWNRVREAPQFTLPPLMLPRLRCTFGAAVEDGLMVTVASRTGLVPVVSAPVGAVEGKPAWLVLLMGCWKLTGEMVVMPVTPLASCRMQSVWRGERGTFVWKGK